MKYATKVDKRIQEEISGKEMNVVMWESELKVKARSSQRELRR